MFDIMVFTLLAALPAIVLMVYFYRQDSLKSEPVGLIGKSVLFGFLAVIPAVGIEMFLDRFTPPGVLGAVFQAFFVAGLVEESVKYFFVKRYLFKRPEFDECMDGIVYTVCVSLGFAFVENIFYGISNRNALLIRAFTAVPMHAIASGIMGYFIGRAKVTKAENPGSLSLRGLFWAVVVHGFYDVFLFLGGLSALFSLFVLLSGWFALRHLVKSARQIDVALFRRDAPLDSGN